MRDKAVIAEALAAFDVFRTLKGIQKQDNSPETLVCGVLWWVLGQDTDFTKLATETVGLARTGLGRQRFAAVVKHTAEGNKNNVLRKRSSKRKR